MDMAADSPDNLEVGPFSILRLVKCLADRPAMTPKIFLLTANAQATAGTAVKNLDQSTIWGLGRVIGHQEFSDLWGGLIDIDTADDAGDHLIKRVIGMPGDHVECCDAQGRVSVNGTAVDEPYVYPGNPPSLVEFDEDVPEDHVWVMGDHRSNSGDSRFNGTVPMDRVTGSAFLVIWPLGSIGTLSDSDAFDAVPAPQ